MTLCQPVSLCSFHEPANSAMSTSFKCDTRGRYQARYQLLLNDCIDENEVQELERTIFGWWWHGIGRHPCTESLDGLPFHSARIDRYIERPQASFPPDRLCSETIPANLAGFSSFECSRDYHLNSYRGLTRYLSEHDTREILSAISDYWFGISRHPCSEF